MRSALESAEVRALAADGASRVPQFVGISAPATRATSAAGRPLRDDKPHRRRWRPLRQRGLLPNAAGIGVNRARRERPIGSARSARSASSWRLASRSQPRRPCALDRPLQLIAALLAQLLVVIAIDLAGLLEDLAADLLVVAVGVLRVVGMNLRAVNSDHPDRDQPAPGTERQHPTEQLATRMRVSSRSPGVEPLAVMPSSRRRSAAFSTSHSTSRKVPVGVVASDDVLEAARVLHR